jgi:hypothetical protein
MDIFGLDNKSFLDDFLAVFMSWFFRSFVSRNVYLLGAFVLVHCLKSGSNTENRNRG